MKNHFNPSEYFKRGCDNKPGLRLAGLNLVALAMFLFAALAIVQPFLVQAQMPLNVTSLSANAGADSTTVSITANGSLGRAQTWQDGDGYHIVIPNATESSSFKTARGIKVRRIGSSLEILVQTRVGASVQVQSSNNKLELAIAGKLQPRATEAELASTSSTSDVPRVPRDPQDSVSTTPDGPALNFSSPVGDLASKSAPTSSETAQNSTNWSPQMGPQVGAPAQAPAQLAEPVTSTAPASEIEIQPEEDGLIASVFSGSSVFVVMALGLFGLLVSRKLRSRQAVVAASGKDRVVENDAEPVAEKVAVEAANRKEPGSSLVRTSETARVANSNGSSEMTRQAPAKMQVAGPATLFGAYRIDQEVGKLVYGQPHRLDVLSSRAVDDRRAIETSLIKCVNSSELDDDGRRKAREALEEYGFVARQCATLLLAADAFERTTAARALGEIKSPAALPFLLEGLYDSESIVRNQAVVSIGELKLPSAIGALLDIARSHPDVPSALLSRTLSACSVEGLDFFDAIMPEPALLAGESDSHIVEQITHLEPTSSVEDLPETIDDERLSQALVSVLSSDVQERAEALKTLAQFRVQNAIDAMTLVARNDSEPNLRSTAISSLGTINHESVFPAILIGMADEAREVRASAARSLNRLSFDRSEAYVRVIETSDEATIGSVAQACVQAGIVSQNLDRLAISDHRQAYEAFSLISLLAKAKMNQPVLNAISDHANVDVRIKAVHLLACTGQPEVADQLRELAVKEGMREDVKTALLEALYKLEQVPAASEETDPTVSVESNQEAEMLAVEEVGDPMPDFDDMSDIQVELVPEPELEEEPGDEYELNDSFEFGPMFEVESQLELEEIEE